MSERKVLNKYYPPDYDPSKIPKGKRNKNATFNIRIMAPFNMRCNMCKEYIYKGKKFNSRKEDVTDEDYLGLKIFRFYIKCPRCVSEIAFKTDLQNTDYTLEAGAKRLFEAEKIAQQMAEEERKAKEEEEMNPMKLLENRTKASRQEMDQIDTLEELRELNTRKNLVNTDEMIEKYRKYEEMLQKLQMEKEEEEIKEIFGDKSGKLVRRLEDSDEEVEPAKKKLAISSTLKPTDILAEDSDKGDTGMKQKAPEVWQKSVGSLSSKQKLKGLVTVKKKAYLPVAVTKSSDNTNDSSSQSSEYKPKIPAGSGSKSSASESNETDSQATLKTAEILKTGSSTENSAEKNVKDSSVNGVQTAGSSVGKGKSNALSLLGAYPDSDSDNSE